MDVKVNTAVLELRTAKLSKAILRQMPLLGYDTVKSLIKDGQIQNVIGWVHGSVLGEDYETWLIIRVEEGVYGRYAAMLSARQKHPQIYIV